MLLQVDGCSSEILISQSRHLTPARLKMDIYREMIQQLRVTNQFQCSLPRLSGQVILPLLLLQSPLYRGFTAYQNIPVTTFEPNTLFGELSYPQISTCNGFLATSTAATHTSTDILSQRLPTFSVNNSGNGRPRACWCKIRAAVMWKMVRRDAAARRKAKSPFYFY